MDYNVYVGARYKLANGDIISVHYVCTGQTEVGIWDKGQTVYMSMFSFHWYLFIMGAVEL